jgi:hypothetical protein
VTVHDLDWWPWYRDLLDALLATVEAASITWATDGDGTPFVIAGQRRPMGIDYPHAMILRFATQRDEAESRRDTELHRVSTSVSVFRDGDPHDPAANFRQAMADMAAVQTALYSDRTLGGEAEYLTVDQADPFSLENANGETETVGDLQVTITKTAE